MAPIDQSHVLRPKKLFTRVFFMMTTL